ncbi:unnamed protein product [Vitrella brassicaformis CCMP3155]|uniref:Uncharacterized protein n=1 Tax=Vitrella brassicaformis (strain CCMP3155) TaxID=1169540 RepID=A0A0G4G4U4_VITBC|nr:unnamed protein product [Vitrella brassicaformis CCMP3155]|eukprot:CEM23333.1 unnamed protein product [Vitrella brassicaformis CCMP3155]
MAASTPTLAELNNRCLRTWLDTDYLRRHEEERKAAVSHLASRIRVDPTAPHLAHHQTTPPPLRERPCPVYPPIPEETRYVAYGQDYWRRRTRPPDAAERAFEALVAEIARREEGQRVPSAQPALAVPAPTASAPFRVAILYPHYSQHTAHALPTTTTVNRERSSIATMPEFAEDTNAPFVSRRYVVYDG